MTLRPDSSLAPLASAGGAFSFPFMADISVRFRFFARYAEVLGRDQMDLAMPAGSTVAQAIVLLRDRLAAAGRIPEHPMTAVNRAHVPGRHVLADGDELALLPPLAGG